MNRRDMLKYFGVGATIIPIVGGAAVENAEARLIEEPKVELIKATRIPKDLDLDNVETVSVSVNLVMRNGERRSIQFDHAVQQLSANRPHVREIPYGSDCACLPRPLL